MLYVEHDCSEVFVSVGCIPQEVCTPLHAGGVLGGLVPSVGFKRPPGGGSGAVPLKLKIDKKFPCKML